MYSSVKQSVWLLWSCVLYVYCSLSSKILQNVTKLESVVQFVPVFGVWCGKSLTAIGRLGWVREWDHKECIFPFSCFFSDMDWNQLIVIVNPELPGSEDLFRIHRTFWTVPHEYAMFTNLILLLIQYFSFWIWPWEMQFRYLDQNFLELWNSLSNIYDTTVLFS